MLEILGIILLCNKNKANALARGRKPGGFVALTICLWFGLEIIGGIIGGAADLGLVTYLIAIIMAAIGGLISYIVAKTCKPGNYIPPAQKIAQEIYTNTEHLTTPAQLTIVREGSMMGAAVNWRFFLNGKEIGSLGNGRMLTVSTDLKRNMLVAKDAYGSELPPFVFEVEAGANAEIHFKANKFLPERSTGLLIPSQVSQQPTAAIPVAPTQSEMTRNAQAVFCFKCGAQLEEGASFCAKCGQRRFESAQEREYVHSVETREHTTIAGSAITMTPNPMRAVWTGVWLIGAWIFIFLLHCIPGMRLLYCGPASYMITSVLLGVGVYLLLQKEVKWKAFAAGTLVLAVLLTSLNSSAAQIYQMNYGTFRFSELFSSPWFGVSLPENIIEVAAAAGFAVLFGWLLRNKPEKERIWQTALYTALAVLAVDLIYTFVSSPSIRYPIQVVILLISLIIAMTTLFLTLPATHALCSMRQKRINLSGWGLIWCWIGAIGMFISFCMGIGTAVTFFMRMYSSQFLLSIVALAGFIMLLSGRRLGWYFILFGSYIALVGQFQASLFPVIQGATNNFPQMLGAILGAANPVITWFSIRSAWLRTESIGTPIKAVACPTRQQHSTFDKFVAIFNLCAGSFFIIFPFFFVFAGSHFQTSMLASIIPGMLFAGYSIVCLCIMKRRYPTGMKVLGIVLFSIAALILFISLIAALAQA